MAASKSDKGTGQSSDASGRRGAARHAGHGSENICRTCKGSGQVNNKPCPDCGGTGKVTEGIGGA
jgi:DnaJ-class molecular chaperone